MPGTISYKSTTIACYIGNFVQAVVINLTPILFIPLREQFGLSFGQLGTLILINFFTQVLCDILFSGMVDKYGFRRFVTIAHLLAALGFILFAAAPFLFPKNPYTGFILATIVFSGSGGLLELLLSPIVNSIPTDEKATAMSVLHSFYSWGQVAVVIITTLFLFLFQKTSWQMIVLIWAILPVINFFLFMKVPLAPPIPEEHRQGMKDLLFKPFFIVSLLAIMFGAMAELCISQWSSAFMEKAMLLPKTVGDILGMCFFAAMMGVGRLFYGIYGERIKVANIMLIGAGLSILCYLAVALSPFNSIALLACGLCGLGVSLLWPGTLVLAAEKYPLAGAWMFAILAAAGDIGASVGPWLIGIISETGQSLVWVKQVAAELSLTLEQVGLRLGMLVGALFPVGALVCIIWMKKRLYKQKSK